MSVATPTQLIPTTVGEEEEEEEIAMLAKELDKYFLSRSTSSASSPISNQLETMHEHLNGTFPMDPTLFMQL